jgi:HEAT repeat protein
MSNCFKNFVGVSAGSPNESNLPKSIGWLVYGAAGRPIDRGFMNQIYEEIQSLIEALEQGPEQRRQAQSSLISLEAVVVEPLIEAVKSGQGQKCWAAAEVLGELADPRAFQVLVDALRADNPMLSGVALNALLKYRGRDILPYLVQAFPNVHILTKQCIILAFQRLNDRRAVRFLIKQLEMCDSVSICLFIIQSLGRLGDPSAVPAVRARLNDSNPYVRELAAIILGQLETG